MATTKRDYYEILEVTRESTADQIKKSYRRLAVKFHPDKNPDDPAAEERFKELGEAYDILMDEQKRAAYDRYGHAAFAQGGGGGGGGGFHDPFEIFRAVFGESGGDIFGSFFGGGRDRDGRQRGADMRYDLQITLEEAASGVEKEIELIKMDTCETCAGSGAKAGSSAVTCRTCQGRGQVISSRGFFQVAQTCPKCRGTGKTIEDPCPTCAGEGRQEKKSRLKLRIPAGVDDGNRMRSSGGGESGLRGGPPGDLHIVIHVKEHPIFQREEDNLYCEVPISFVTATLGGEVKVPTLDGKASIKVPPGTQSSTLFKLRGKGMPHLQSSSKGDLVTKVIVEVPTRLNAEQKKKLEEFAELCGEENTPLHKSFFEKAKEFFT